MFRGQVAFVAGATAEASKGHHVISLSGGPSTLGAWALFAYSYRF